MFAKNIGIHPYSRYVYCTVAVYCHIWIDVRCCGPDHEWIGSLDIDPAFFKKTPYRYVAAHNYFTHPDIVRGLDEPT